MRLLLRTEVVLDVERLSDFLGGLALDHRGHFGAREVEERGDVHVVGGQNQLEEHFLLAVDERGVPGGDHVREVGRSQRLHGIKTQEGENEKRK